MTDQPFLTYEALLTTTKRTVEYYMEGPNAAPSLAMGAVLLFKWLGVSYAPDALLQQCEDDAAHLTLLIEQLRAAAPTNG